jgi:hypothetical protein
LCLYVYVKQNVHLGRIPSYVDATDFVANRSVVTMNARIVVGIFYDGVCVEDNQRVTCTYTVSDDVINLLRL